MTEQTARLVLTISVASAILCYMVAIALGLRGDQPPAIMFFIFALLESGMAVGFFRRYTTLRSTRWERELRDSEIETRRKLEEDEKAGQQKTLGGRR